MTKMSMKLKTKAIVAVASLAIVGASADSTSKYVFPGQVKQEGQTSLRAGRNLAQTTEVYTGIAGTDYDRLRSEFFVDLMGAFDSDVKNNPKSFDIVTITIAVAFQKMYGTVPAFLGLKREFVEELARIAGPVPQALQNQINAMLAGGGGGRRLEKEETKAAPAAPVLSESHYRDLTSQIDPSSLNPDSYTFIITAYNKIMAGVNNPATQSQVVTYTHINDPADPSDDSHDQYGVSMANGECYIGARETDELGANGASQDQLQNFYSEKLAVLKVGSTTGNGLSGYGGFVKTYNLMRDALWAAINTHCIQNGATKFNFYGWSRGGSLASIASAALTHEGKLNRSKVRLMTVGACRVLAVEDLLKVHQLYEQWRLVSTDDFIPSFPASYRGLSHFGTLVAREPNYALGRNEPYFQYAYDPLFTSHFEYFSWFSTEMGRNPDHAPVDNWFSASP